MGERKKFKGWYRGDSFKTKVWRLNTPFALAVAGEKPIVKSNYDKKAKAVKVTAYSAFDDLLSIKVVSGTKTLRMREKSNEMTLTYIGDQQEPREKEMFFQGEHTFKLRDRPRSSDMWVEAEDSFGRVTRVEIKR